ncbi:MAG: hypothetical protein ACPF8V_11470 [Luteibaculum sp.]
MRNFFLLLFCLAFTTLAAQYKRRLNPIFTESPGYPQSGWFWEAGVTYGYHQGDVENAIVRETTDSLVVADLSPSSMPFGYVGVGRFTLIPRGIIFNMIDYGIGFKGLFYNQDFKGDLFFKNDIEAAPQSYEDEGRWSDYNVTLNLNLNRYFQVSEKVFIMPGIGIHGDFRVGGRQTESLDREITGYEFPETIQVNTHARINVGIKIHRELFIVPGFELNLVDAMNFEEPKITRRYFNTEYLPMMLSVKVMYHKPPRLKPCKVGVSDVDLDNTRRRKRKIQLF